MANAYVAPEYGRKSFHCPNCGVLAHQIWMENLTGLVVGTSTRYKVADVSATVCSHCDKGTIWWSQERMIYPASGAAPLANPDLPEDIADDYNEARAIVSQSPRGAAALLRLAIQKLCQHAGQPGKNLNDDVGALVKKGLPVAVQQALDSVRVIGNNAVHPGQIDLRDDTATAGVLFELVNFVAEKLISEPKAIAEFYSKLPAGSKEAIERRDKGTASRA